MVYAVLQKPSFARKLSDPSLAEVTSLFGDFASTVWEAFIRNGFLILPKKGDEAGRYYASEALRNPKTQNRKLTSLRKTHPAAEILQLNCSTNFPQKVRPN